MVGSTRLYLLSSVAKSLAGVCLKEVWRFDVDAQLWNRLDEPPWNPRRGAIPVVCEGLGCFFWGKGNGEAEYFFAQLFRSWNLDWVS